MGSVLTAVSFRKNMHTAFLNTSISPGRIPYWMEFNIYDARIRAGKALAASYPVDADLVTGSA